MKKLFVSRDHVAGGFNWSIFIFAHVKWKKTFWSKNVAISFEANAFLFIDFILHPIVLNLAQNIRFFAPLLLPLDDHP